MKKGITSTADTHGNGNRSEASNVLYSKGTKHDANLRKNGFIYFQIGLILAMVLVFFGLEFAVDKLQPTIKVEHSDPSQVFEYHADANNFKVEKDKVIEQSIERRTNPDKIRIIEDDVAINPKLEFKGDPTPDGDPNLTAGQIIVPTDPDDDIVIPVAFVDEVPIFPGCEKVEKAMQRTCFEEKIQKHILRNFRYPESAIDTRTEGKVFTTFTIGKNGLIEDIQLKGPAKILENEAERIIDRLPQMTPGKRRNKPVRVSFSIPINFQLQ